MPRAQDSLAVGNPAGPYTNFTAEQMRGADAVFGSNNVDVVVPVTDPRCWRITAWRAFPAAGVRSSGALRTR